MIDFFAENEKEEKFHLLVLLASTFPAQSRQCDYYFTPKAITEMLESCLIVSCSGIFYLNYISTWSQVLGWGIHGKLKYLCVFFMLGSFFSRKASPVIWYVVVYWCVLVIDNTSKGTRSQSYESCKIFCFNWIDLYVIEFTEFLFSYNFWFLMSDIEWEIEKNKI